MSKQSDVQKKKMIAPFAITIGFLIYLAVYIALLLTMSNQLHWVMIFFAIPLAALGIGMVYTLRSRIAEIRSGDEDDLDKY